MTRSTLILPSLTERIIHRLSLFLVVFISALSYYWLVKLDTGLDIITAISIFIALGIWQAVHRGNLIILSLLMILLVVHTAYYLLFVTTIGLFWLTVLTTIIVNLILWVAMSAELNITDYLILSFVSSSTFITVTYLPTALVNLTVLCLLPLMVLMPTLTKKTTRLLPLALHATLVSIIGAGLIAATANMFI